MFSTRFPLLAALLVSVTACAGDSPDKSANDGSDDDHGQTTGASPFSISGKVVHSGSGTSTPAADVAVRVSVDINADGALAGDEVVDTVSDENGAYTATISAAAGGNLVVRFRESGYATAYRTVRIAGGASAIVDARLAPLDALTCDAATGCNDANRTLSVRGLADGMTAAGHTFNPVNDAAQFPGRFADDRGNMLLSGVFAAVELSDQNGDAVDTLAAPATLSMRLPIDTWPVVTDIDPAAAGIQVPLYAFDPVKGEWVRESQGELVDAAGNSIAASALADIRAGTYGGVVYVSGEVRHFSYWNCDWPITSHGCLTFDVVDSAHRPVPGATVTVDGRTYNGTSSAVTPSSAGAVCVDVLRSELSGEDVDNDGIPGETQSVIIRVAVGDKLYDLGVADVGTTVASCGDGSCTDLGELVVDEAHVLTPALCTITGTVRDNTGAALADASIVAFDEVLDFALAASLCASGECFTTTSASDGSFTVVTVVEAGIELFGSNSATESDGMLFRTRFGSRTFDHCPTAPVTLILDGGIDEQILTISVQGDELSWTPNVAVDQLVVYDAGGAVKWLLLVDQAQFSGPVVFGVIPAGVLQFYPADDAPPEGLSPDDRVLIFGQSTTAAGYPITYVGETAN